MHVDVDSKAISRVWNSLRVYVEYESRWLCGNTLASDANGPGSTPGATLELDTDYHPFMDR